MKFYLAIVSFEANIMLLIALYIKGLPICISTSMRLMNKINEEVTLLFFAFILSLNFYFWPKSEKKMKRKKNKSIISNRYKTKWGMQILFEHLIWQKLLINYLWFLFFFFSCFLYLFLFNIMYLLCLPTFALFLFYYTRK